MVASNSEVNVNAAARSSQTTLNTRRSEDERTLADGTAGERGSDVVRDVGKNGEKTPNLNKEGTTAKEAEAEGRLALRRKESRAAEVSTARADGKILLHERDVYDQLGYSFSWQKKWSILFVVAMVQLAMNYNSSCIGNALPGVRAEFGVGQYAALTLQGLFLIAYAFGCELWAAPSEEFGRWKILQLSMLLENCWTLMCALAPNFATLVVGRVLGGLSLAGGSVTLGMVADLYEPEYQGYAVAWVVLSSVGGTTIGPIFGGFQGQWLDWRWSFWIQLIFLGCTQILHFFTPETKASVLAARIAKQKRKNGEGPYYAPEELKEDRWNVRDVLKIWYRPFYMFITEPIVLCLSLLSGFSDALIFTFLEGFRPVYGKWGFSTYQVGLAFVPIGLGYLIAYFSFLPFIRSNIKALERNPETPPERRLYWLLYLAPLEAIGLFGFAWTSLGPPQTHWIAPMIFSCLVGIANYAIYMATIDYMINSYGIFAASATGGNGFARDFLAGVAAFYSSPMFTNIGDKYNVEWASTILAILAALVCIPVYWIYMRGPQIREASPFAVSLDKGRKEERALGRTTSRKPTHHEHEDPSQRA